nr:PREDICTED: uncharacterized protein LOC105669123 [Linepithema humile]
MLKAKNAHTIEKLNFTLHVMAEPYPALERTASYYTPNTNAEFHCKVLSFPPPNITWSFWKCPNYPLFENSTIVQLTEKKSYLFQKSTTKVYITLLRDSLQTQ